MELDRQLAAKSIFQATATTTEAVIANIRAIEAAIKTTGKSRQEDKEKSGCDKLDRVSDGWLAMR